MDPNALHNISYGMYIVSSVKDGKGNAQIANTLMQITNEPITLAVSINKDNLTHDFIESSSLFGLSVLENDTPLNLIGKYGFKSGRDMDKMKDAEVKIVSGGCPVILDNAICYFVAKVVNQMDCGSYSVFLGEVMESEIVKTAEPMTYAYYHLVKCGNTPKTAPTYIEGENEEKVCSAIPKYRCTVCNYIYNPDQGDPDGGIAPGTPFEEIPDDWVCPICGVSKEKFAKVE